MKDLIENYYLKAIIDSYPRVRNIAGIGESKENDIRDLFIRDFERHNTILRKEIANKTLRFSPENRVIKEDKTFRTDIEFFISVFGPFVVECKRLKSAEGRYVNGIEKFTSSAYAERDRYAGMVGFIIGGNISVIVENLKEKVKQFEFCGGEEALLEQKCGDWNSSFQSKHIRVKRSSIHIYHLFFDFS